MVEYSLSFYKADNVCVFVIYRTDDSQSIHRRGCRKVFWAAVLLLANILIGCSQSEVGYKDEYLIRVAGKVVTVNDFKRAFENGKRAFPQTALQNPITLKNVRLRLLNQMTEEMLILKRAEELQIDVPESELEKPLQVLNGIILKTFLKKCYLSMLYLIVFGKKS